MCLFFLPPLNLVSSLSHFANIYIVIKLSVLIHMFYVSFPLASFPSLCLSSINLVTLGCVLTPASSLPILAGILDVHLPPLPHPTPIQPCVLCRQGKKRNTYHWSYFLIGCWLMGKSSRCQPLPCLTLKTNQQVVTLGIRWCCEEVWCYLLTVKYPGS